MDILRTSTVANEEKTKKSVSARITDPLGLESEVVTPLAVSASVQMLMGRRSLTQKRQAHMLETHLAEVKLLYVVVPSVAQPVWQNVAAQLAVFHETVGLVESSQTTHTTWDILHLFPNFS